MQELTQLCTSSSQFEGNCELPWGRLTRRKDHLPVKSQQGVTWAFIILPFALYLLELFIDEQCKAVHQGAEV